MYIQDDGNDGEEQEMKEIKVKIPVDYHWKLHTLKLTTDAYISEMVRDALGGYFGEVFEKDDGAEADAPETA
jgi:hypothetical protein